MHEMDQYGNRSSFGNSIEEHIRQEECERQGKCKPLTVKVSVDTSEIEKQLADLSSFVSRVQQERTNEIDNKVIQILIDFFQEPVTKVSMLERLHELDSMGLEIHVETTYPLIQKVSVQHAIHCYRAATNVRIYIRKKVKDENSEHCGN